MSHGSDFGSLGVRYQACLMLVCSLPSPFRLCAVPVLTCFCDVLQPHALSDLQACMVVDCTPSLHIPSVSASSTHSSPRRGTCRLVDQVSGCLMLLTLCPLWWPLPSTACLLASAMYDTTWFVPYYGVYYCPVAGRIKALRCTRLAPKPHCVCMCVDLAEGVSELKHSLLAQVAFVLQYAVIHRASVQPCTVLCANLFLVCSKAAL